MNKEQYLKFIKDVRRTLEWVGENIEDEENALTIITWINKMAVKLKENLDKLEDFKKEFSEENKDENNISE